mmetsp:Transcript_31134/g.89833  ORF Transcript_31134/g.89833 Transcript_31134/m.89833 type:complete len:242 (+) Transcript_31134:2007-2732(+)
MLQIGPPFLVGQFLTFLDLLQHLCLDGGGPGRPAGARPGAPADGLMLILVVVIAVCITACSCNCSSNRSAHPSTGPCRRVAAAAVGGHGAPAAAGGGEPGLALSGALSGAQGAGLLLCLHAFPLSDGLRPGHLCRFLIGSLGPGRLLLPVRGQKHRIARGPALALERLVLRSLVGLLRLGAGRRSLLGCLLRSRLATCCLVVLAAPTSTRSRGLGRGLGSRSISGRRLGRGLLAHLHPTTA